MDILANISMVSPKISGRTAQSIKDTCTTKSKGDGQHNQHDYDLTAVIAHVERTKRSKPCLAVSLFGVVM